MAGGPYNIPRNTKGEGRFLYIFSTKALIVTIVLGLIGFGLFYPTKKIYIYSSSCCLWSYRLCSNII